MANNWLDYKDLDGPGKVDRQPEKTIHFDRHDWSRASKPEKNFLPPGKQTGKGK